MKKIYLHNICLILLLTVFFLSACSYKQQHVLFKTDVATAAPLYNQGLASGNSAYKIGPDDLLQIRNLQNISYIANEQPSATGTTAPAYQVEEDGTVALPVIGRVMISGLTRFQAARKIELLYKEKLLKDPIIDLKIINLKVTLLGEIRTQGNYLLLKDKTSLVDIIGEAGGLTDKANEKNIKIIRGDKAHPQIIMADLNDIRTLANPELNLQNNDIIYIAQNNRTVRNDATQNLSSIIQPILVLLNTALVIFTLTRK